MLRRTSSDSKFGMPPQRQGLAKWQIKFTRLSRWKEEEEDKNWKFKIVVVSLLKLSAFLSHWIRCCEAWHQKLNGFRKFNCLCIKNEVGTFPHFSVTFFFIYFFVLSSHHLLYKGKQAAADDTLQRRREERKSLKYEREKIVQTTEKTSCCEVYAWEITNETAALMGNFWNFPFFTFLLSFSSHYRLQHSIASISRVNKWLENDVYREYLK